MAFEAYPETSFLSDFLQDCEVLNFSPEKYIHTKVIWSTYSRYLLEIFFLALKDFLTYIRDEKRYASSMVENFFASLSSFFDYSDEKEYKNYNPNIQKNILDITKNSVMKKGSLSAWVDAGLNRFCWMDQV